MAVVGVPIAFVGIGERIEDLEPFHAERLVSRVLGMGDVLSLIEKAEQAIDRDEAERLEARIRHDDFTLEDFRDQLRTIRRMGSVEEIVGMLPGMGRHEGAGRRRTPDEGQLARIEAIINSMTPAERRNYRLVERQPAQADRARQRHDRRGRQPPAQAVRADAEDVEGRRRPVGRRRRRGGGGR